MSNARCYAKEISTTEIIIFVKGYTYCRSFVGLFYNALSTSEIVTYKSGEAWTWSQSA